MAFNDLLGYIGLSGSGGGIVGLVTTVLIALCALGIIIGIIWYVWNLKRWNIKVNFHLPRNVAYTNGLELDEMSGDVLFERGKGMYDSKKGVVFVKRKWKRKTPMKPFNINKYLQGNSTLSVVQSGADTFIPIIPKSYLIYEDDQTGERCALLKLKADATESKAWKNSFERDAKTAYSVINLLKEYAPIITIGLVIFLWGLQMLLLYNRMG